MKMYIMRGVPGSGKSYTAKQLAGEDGVICSADDFFEKKPGGYRANWRPDLLFVAHKTCVNNARKACEDGAPVIVIDNTNIARRDTKPYVELAKEFGYEVELAEATSEWWLEIKELMKDKKANQAKLEEWSEKLSGKNHHGVPPSTLMKMLGKYTEYELG